MGKESGYGEEEEEEEEEEEVVNQFEFEEGTTRSRCWQDNHDRRHVT
jgi:hypothetical protein